MGIFQVKICEKIRSFFLGFIWGLFRGRSSSMRKAFLLGAGLGTRLQPLTNTLPKPLIPVYNRPLAAHALDHCIDAGITDFAINTHHLHEEWEKEFPNGQYRGATLTFFYEEDLLETGGGIKNIESWVNGDPFLVYNGDILTDIRIDKLMTGHMASNNTATLAVRSTGPSLQLELDGRLVSGIHGKSSEQARTHQFTGIYCVDPDLLNAIPAETKISVIPAFLELIEKKRLGAYVADDGDWYDLGSREAYLVVEAGAQVSESILWPGTKVSQDAQLTKCIVHSTNGASGTHHNADL